MPTSPAPPPPRLFVDCTETHRLRANTGIQRAVRSLVAAGMAQAGATASWIPVRFDGRHFVALDAAALRRLAVPGAEPAPRRLLRAAALAGARSPLLFRSVAHPALQGLARRAVSWGYWHGRALGAVGAARRVTFRESDWLVLVDSNWLPDLRPELVRARREGARVCAVVYDLIQIDRPELISPGAGTIYRRWFEAVLPLADRVLTISRAVRDAVSELLRRRPELSAANGDVRWFRLGSDFNAPHDAAAPSAGVQALFADAHAGPAFLVVGTLDLRKDQRAVLDAFERLWREGNACRLVFVGRQGWGSHDLAKRIARHPERGRRLHWLADAGDADLEYCYRHADALVNASLCEGFGLPIVEGAEHGLPVIASDIPAFREIGADRIRYFPPGDTEALARAVQAALRGEIGPALLCADAARTWSEAAQELASTLVAGPERPRPA